MQRASLGKVISLISSELVKLEDGLRSFPNTLSCLFVNFIVYGLIWYLTTVYYSLAVLGLTILTTLLLVYLITFQEKYFELESEVNSVRVKIINDTLVGIKTIKCFTWEEKYEKLIKRIRDK